MKKRIVWWLVIVVVFVAGYYVWSHRFGVPEDFTDPAAAYKYGSIGADHPMALAPIPFWIWKVLPELVPPSAEEFKKLDAGPWNGKKGFEAFGLVTEAGMEHPQGFKQGDTVFDRPIGLSKRTVFGIDFVGVNCAFCHLTTIRRLPDEKPIIILGGTGNSLNIEQYFLYMFATMGDKKRFNADDVMEKVSDEVRKQNKDLSFVERLVYRYVAIPLIPRILEARKKEYFDFITAGNKYRLKNFGPGRVDTWALYKRLYVNPKQPSDVDDKVINGIVDFPSIWNQRARAGMQMHWDGNIAVAEERNIISALSVIGTRLDYLDFPRLTRTAEFANRLIPLRYEDWIPEQFRVGNQRIQQDLAERGRGLFQNHCASCHAPDGDRVGRVEPNEGLVTDSERLRDFTPELADGLNRLGTDAWKLRNFKPQHGYVNALLDGIWLRAPYLHNGSVPTLRDLLDKAEDRPAKFCTGNDEYDWKNVGFKSATKTGNGDAICGEYFLYDTTVSCNESKPTDRCGNGNAGHLYGTDLNEKDKADLLEFLKTL